MEFFKEAKKKLDDGAKAVTGNKEKVMDAIGKAENNENAGKLRGAVLAQLSAWEEGD